jgi:hypothetical protein
MRKASRALRKVEAAGAAPAGARGGEVERILSQALILGDRLMRGPTGGTRREHLDLADAGRLQNGLRQIGVIAHPGDFLDDRTEQQIAVVRIRLLSLLRLRAERVGPQSA